MNRCKECYKKFKRRNNRQLFCHKRCRDRYNKYISYRKKYDSMKYTNLNDILNKEHDESWDSYWRKGDPDRGIGVRVVDNIYYCQYEWGWKDVGDRDLVDAFKQKMPTYDN